LAQRIIVLPGDLIGKIAAGEVIERPASVVKELVENAIDAGAELIKIEIKDGGRSLIRVTDDGEGIAGDEMALAVSQHATSKISRAEDLNDLHTLGFRGEALASIASVSKMEITSKRIDAPEGTKLTLVGGEIIDRTAAGVPTGTQVEIRDLFYNVPARKDFLKSTATEFGHIANVFWRFVIIRPHISFRLINNGKEIFKFNRTTELDERVASYWKLDRKSLLPVKLEDRYVSVKGYLAPDPNIKMSSQGIMTFVNERSIQDKAIAYHVRDTWHRHFGRDSRPNVILIIKMQPHLVDFNVHPAKSEVRFANQKLVYGSVRQSIGKAISEHPLRDNEDVPIFSKDNSIHVARPSSAINGIVSDPYRSPAQPEPFSSREYPAPRKDESSFDSSREFLGADRILPPTGENFFGSLKIIGQYLNTYILCEGASGIVCIDQHAAHERITFEKLKLQRSRGQIESQQLMFPLQMELDYTYNEIMKELQAPLKELGMEVVHFGENTWNIRSLPAFMRDIDGRILLKGILDETAAMIKSSRLSNIDEEILKLLACHSSVRANMALEREEIQALLKDMDNFGQAGRCPHGRPFYRIISSREVRRMFGRP
jgi:DNA mismatch repair protein MutL